MKLSEALTLLGEANFKLYEASTEILAKIEQLKTADPDISPEGMAIINAIGSKASALANIVPEIPATPPAPEA